MESLLHQRKTEVCPSPSGRKNKKKLVPRPLNPGSGWPGIVVVELSRGEGQGGSRKVRPWWRRRRGVASIGKKVDGERDSLIYIDPAKTDTQLGYMYM